MVARMSVRATTIADSGAIARVQTAAWEAVYRGIVPDSLFDRLTVQVRTEQWTRFHELSPDRSVVLIAETDGGEVVGMAALGPTRDEDLNPETVGEIRAIYVDPQFCDLGFGKQLMVESLGWMVDTDFSQASLWVLDTNLRGRSFYERGGWVLDGAAKVDESMGDPLNEVRYRITLRRASP